MAVHGKDSRQGNIDDDVYASVDFSVSMPKYRFPQTEHEPRHAYAVVHDELMLDGNARQNLAGELEKLGSFEIIYGGQRDAGIPTLCWRMKDGADPGYSLYDLADRLRARGWQVPAYSLPAHCETEVIQRILVRHGVSRDLGSLLLDDMKGAMDYFAKHPVQVPMDSTEASGFHH